MGEVLVGESDAEWVTDGERVAVRIRTAGQPTEIDVLDAALAAVKDEPQLAAVAADLRSEVD